MAGAAIICLTLLFLSSTNIAAAQVSQVSAPAAQASAPAAANDKTASAACDINNGSILACALYITAYLVNLILGLLIQIGAWLVRLALEFSTGIVNAPAVQAGFGVSLAIANLGFILGIIVVALATILRSQTYGIKQILWKLVVAAILVNFSLVICGAILGFSESLTNHFMSGSGATGSFLDFVNKLTDSFSPQALQQPTDSASSSWSDKLCSGRGLAIGTAFTGGLAATLCGARAAAKSVQSAVGAVGFVTGIGRIDNLIKQTLALVFSIVFGLVLALTVLALAIMLLIRYVYLGVLLILAPLAWLMWIFPNFAHLWSKWWNNFLRWAMFAPLVVFFLYLAILTATSSSYLEARLAAGTEGVDPRRLPETGIMASSDTSVGALASAGKGIIVIALALGGLFAANSLSITGASTAMGLAKSAGGAVQGFVGKQAKKGGRAAYQGIGGEKLTQRLQRSRIPGVSMVGRGIAGLTERGGKKLVEADSREASSKDSDRLALELRGFMGNEKRLAFLSELQRRGDLKKVEKTGIGGRSFNEYMKNEKLFQNYGQGKLYGDIGKQFGADKVMRDAAEAAAADPNAQIVDEKGIVGEVGATVNALQLLGEATRRFAETLERGKDVPQMDLDSVFSGQAMFGRSKETNDLLAKQLAATTALKRPELMPSMLNRFKKAGNRERFVVEYRQTIEGSDLSADEKEKRLDALKDSIGNLALGLIPEVGAQPAATAAAAGAATAAPPPPPQPPR